MKQITQLKKEKHKWPIVDIIICESAANEGDKDTTLFSLFAEVKFSYPFGKAKSRRPEARLGLIKHDLERLREFKNLEICREAHFCYLDEHHPKNKRELLNKTFRKYEKTVTVHALYPRGFLEIGPDWHVHLVCDSP